MKKLFRRELRKRQIKLNILWFYLVLRRDSTRKCY
jgi:hypothetical protein